MEEDPEKYEEGEKADCWGVPGKCKDPSAPAEDRNVLEDLNKENVR